MKLSLTTVTALALSAGVAFAGISKPKVDMDGLTQEEITFIEDHNDYLYDGGTAGSVLSLGLGMSWLDQDTNGIFDGSIIGVNSRDVTNDVRLTKNSTINKAKTYKVNSRIRFDTDFEIDNIERIGVESQQLSGIELGKEFPIACYERSFGHECKIYNYHLNVIVRDFPGLAISTHDVVEMLDDIMEDELRTAIRIKQVRKAKDVMAEAYKKPIASVFNRFSRWRR